MIERVWLAVAAGMMALVFCAVFFRYGIMSRQTLEHPFIARLGSRVLCRYPGKLFIFLLCAALFLEGIAASGVRWGVKLLGEYHESRVFGILNDRSGSVQEEQHKLIMAGTKGFLSGFRDSATVSIGPFADRASPSPLFILSLEREYDAALAFLDNIDKIEVGGGTEGGWALYQMFEKLMVPSVLSPDKMRKNIIPWLQNREIREHQKEIREQCSVKDRAVIIQTDAEFYENRLHAAEVLELYRICGVRVYMMSIKGSEPPYLVEAVNSTGGKFKLFPAELVGDLFRFGKAVDEYFNDLLVVERSPQKIRELSNPISRSWIFAAAALLAGMVSAIIVVADARRRAVVFLKKGGK